MSALPTLTSPQIHVLQSLGVTAVYVFGSHAEGSNHPLSDFDIGIVVADRRKLAGDTSHLYNELYNLFTEMFPDQSLDIVFLQRTGLELASDAVSHGRVLFELSPEARLGFEEHVVLLYADFKPLLDQFNSAILERA